jgi:hypothetical protein
MYDGSKAVQPTLTAFFEAVVSIQLTETLTLWLADTRARARGLKVHLLKTPLAKTL